MEERRELKEKLNKIIPLPDSLQRRIGVVAVLTEALKKYKITPVIVGGFAVELWTMGKYATLDIDLIADGITEYASVLHDLGFSNKGGVWIYPDTDIIIEFPKPPLDGDYARLQPLAFQDYQLYVLGIEDIILDRVSAAKFWGDLASKEWAIFLLAAHYQKIDWDYCEKLVREKLIGDVFQEVKDEAEKLLQE